MLTELRRFFLEEEGEIIEWAVFMLILLAFTVTLILLVGNKANEMWNQIVGWLDKVLVGVPRP